MTWILEGWSCVFAFRLSYPIVPWSLPRYLPEYPFLPVTMKETPMQEDDAQLAALGHRPELKRQFSTW